LVYYSFLEATTSKNKSTTLRTTACPVDVRKKARLNDTVGQALRKLAGGGAKMIPHVGIGVKLKLKVFVF
jgi:hypothetical protein